MTINILIVDDQPGAYKELFERLAAIGVSRESVDLEQSGYGALRRLEVKHYDLVILDIALPYRPEDSVDPEGALEILDDLVDPGLAHSPAYVLCITAFESLPPAVERYLDEHLIYLIRSSSANAAWIANVVRFVENVQKVKVQEQSVAFEKDVCILTALRKPEFSAVRHLDWNWSGPKVLNRVMSYVEGSFVSDSKTYEVVASTGARMGMVEAALVAARMVERFRPRLVIMAGICAGYPDETAIGDVICSSPVWNWQSVKRIVSAKGDVDVRPDADVIDIDERLRPLAEELKEDSATLNSIYGNWQGEKPNSQLRLHLGPMASGSAVLADGSFEEIRKTHSRKLVGLEMECYGVFAAVRSIAVARPLVLAFKGVCDHGNYLKSDRYQRYAAYTSAAVSAAFCERYIGKIAEFP